MEEAIARIVYLEGKLYSVKKLLLKEKSMKNETGNPSGVVEFSRRLYFVLYSWSLSKKEDGPSSLPGSSSLDCILSFFLSIWFKRSSS
ncbi:hypothetical protein AX762_02105 [Alkalibacterium sp. 20]|nr:hypothetical protein AX762_02105 [Alkalibacterium sp. 20]